MLLSAEHITKYQNEKCILEDVSFAIEERMKLGLIGVNGVGKTTLLRILAQKEHLDSGRIIRKSGLRVHYLPQNPRFEAGKTIYQCVLDAVNEKQREARTFEIQTMLSKLGMRDYEQSVDVLSGGQRKRVALACALVTECDLLILDEPTNHLDNDMVEWLERYLMKYTKALLMVTHDRYFLERITDHLMEMDQGNLYLYDGNYETYLEMKEQRSQTEAVQLKKRQKLLKKELAWMRAGVQARGTKSQSRIDRFYDLRKQCRNKQEETMQSLDSITTRLGRKIMEINDLCMGFDDNVLFHGVNIQVKKMDRIGIVGPNGCGKTTLLNVLSKKLEPLSGEVVIGETVKLGFFHQGDDHMDLSMRVIDYIRDQGDQIETTDGSRTASQLLEQLSLIHISRRLLLVLQRQGNEKEIVVETVEPIQRLVRTPLQLRETIRIFEDHFHDVPMADLKARLLAQFESRGGTLSSISYHDFDKRGGLLWFEAMDDHHQIDYRAVSITYYKAAEQRTVGLIDDTRIQEVTISNVMKKVNLIKND